METYDYIIIGAGSAGCVLARRLSDNSDARVLLIEAGPPAENFWIRAPAGMARLINSKRYNWNFFTEPVPTLRNRKLHFPRGKALGGSSAINGMVYVRGDRRDFDHWAQLGNTGWGWDAVLPYFKRSESNSRGANEYHSVDGPLAVSDPVLMHPSVIDFIEAARRSGLAHLKDLTAGDQEGVGSTQFTIRNGARESSYDAFLRPVRNRSNLVVKTEAYVRRILFRDRQAVGVELTQGSETVKVFAAREVILSAGALSSPHVLMLSGIGDGEMLQRFGVPIVAHSPGVGQNLQDHFVARIQMKSTPNSSYNRDLRSWRKYWQGARYVLQKQGFLALGSSTAAAFIKSSPRVGYADLEVSFRPMTFTFDASGEVRIDDYDGISASVYRVRPASKGQVVLKSADPMQPPGFHPNFLGDPDDVEAMLSGIRQVRRILQTEPVASRILAEIVPGDKAATDEQLIEHMENTGHCAFHPAGTCKMGSDIDAMAVVDARLRVRGVERLRVADASIMPVVTSCNTNAPTIMIGEKAADMIRTDAAAARPAEALSA